MESSDTFSKENYANQFALPTCGTIKKNILESPPIVAGSYVLMTYKASADLYNEKIDYEETKGDNTQKYKSMT